MPEPNADPVLSFSGLRKQWPDSEHPALDGVDLDIERGRILGLLGPNGAGKTTLLSVLMGLVSANAGTILLDGKPLDRRHRRLRRIAGLVPQDVALYPSLTGRENLAFFAGLLWADRAKRESAVADCAAIADLGETLDRRVGHYSGGQQRRLNLAVGLLGRPRVLFLDEPTVGIDPQSRHFILNRVRRLCDEQGLTVVHTTHYMEEVEHLCDSVAILDHGRVLLHDSLSGALAQARERGKLQISLAAEADRNLLTALEALPCQVTSPGGRRLDLSLSGDQEGIAPVIAAIEQNGHRIENLRFGGNLESLFLSLTGRALRE